MKNLCQFLIPWLRNTDSNILYRKAGKETAQGNNLHFAVVYIDDAAAAKAIIPMHQCVQQCLADGFFRVVLLICTDNTLDSRDGLITQRQIVDRVFKLLKIEPPNSLLSRNSVQDSSLNTAIFVVCGHWSERRSARFVKTPFFVIPKARYFSVENSTPYCLNAALAASKVKLCSKQRSSSKLSPSDSLIIRRICSGDAGTLDAPWRT